MDLADCSEVQEPILQFCIQKYFNRTIRLQYLTVHKPGAWMEGKPQTLLFCVALAGINRQKSNTAIAIIYEQVCNLIFYSKHNTQPHWKSQ